MDYYGRHNRGFKERLRIMFVVHRYFSVQIQSDFKIIILYVQV